MSGISDRQLAANRQNAKKSSGPQTTIGKEISSRNSLTHGILQKSFINCSTNPEERSRYNSIYSNLIDEWDPKGEMETFLVDKIAVDYVRLQRLLHYESLKIQRDLEEYLPLINDNISDQIKKDEIRIEVLENFDHNPIDAVNCVIDLRNLNESRLGPLGPNLIDTLARFEEITSEEKEKFRNVAFKVADHIAQENVKKREYLEKMSRLAFVDSFLNEKEIIKITKYENSIERSIFRNLEKLIALQKMRGKTFE
jgi:hypothetical protein